jgi:hypothetical protein
MNMRLSKYMNKHCVLSVEIDVAVNPLYDSYEAECFVVGEGGIERSVNAMCAQNDFSAAHSVAWMTTCPEHVRRLYAEVLSVDQVFAARRRQNIRLYQAYFLHFDCCDPCSACRPAKFSNNVRVFQRSSFMAIIRHTATTAAFISCSDSRRYWRSGQRIECAAHTRDTQRR